MTNKQTKKAKRPLQTTLGKAPIPNEKEEVDLSHVKKPIETSIHGLHQVINLLKTATEEVKDYITYECDIMYECRLCRSIFRSIANFILHKRNYCHVKCKGYISNCRESNLTGKVHPPEPPENQKLIVGPTATKGLAPVIEKLKEKQEIEQLTQELLSADLSSQKKSESSTTSSQNDMLLEEIATNNSAVFQTVLHSFPQKNTIKPECMKKEIMELHKILESDKAVLGADGKICNFQTNQVNTNAVLPKTELSCSECNIKFSTRKTLSFHLKNKHNNSRLVYVCPDCKETFCNAWSVYRHLFKVHRKTAAQVKRLRDQVYNSIIRKDQEAQKKVEKKECSNLDKADEENQWLNNIEGDNDFQMCGGCGKRFERKAALQSHAAMCIKRIAVCNTIKENNAKKKEEVSKDAKAKLNKPEKSPSPDSPESHLKGALKRKPYLLRTYKQPVLEVSEEITEQTNSSVRNSNDVQTDIGCDTKNVGNKTSNSDNDNKSKNNCDNRNCEISNSYDDNDVKTSCDYSNEEISSDTTVLKEKEIVFPDETPSFNSETEEAKTLKVLETQINTIQLDHRIEVIKEEVSPIKQSDASDKNIDVDIFYTKVSKNLDKIKDSEEETTDSNSKETSANSFDSQGYVSNGLEYQSPGKISIRSLEELRGFPKESVAVDEDMPVLKPSVSSSAPRGSPKSSGRLIKRKRTSSLDTERIHKTFKQSNFDVLLDKQDLNFMARASPYIDRKTLTCKSCCIQHSSLSKLLWHMSAHFSWFRFQCSRCSFVSFSKSECANHAKNIHDIKNNEIAGVVLPIPNWKTLLLSNEFKELNSAREFGGKHTDEVNAICQSEPVLISNNEDDSTINLISTLFVDSESDTADLNELTDIRSFPMPKTEDTTSMKNESIDITEDDHESFQLEVPEEIYTLDVFEVINIDNIDDNTNSFIKKEVEDVNDERIVPNSSSVTPPPIPKEEIGELENRNKSPSSKVVNVRPTRNRMRSIKTLQNDFFYDLGKVSKPTEAVTKTNGSLRQKKNHSSSTVKKY